MKTKWMVLLVCALFITTGCAGMSKRAKCASVGAAAGAGCFYGATTLKRKFGYDDSLDVFGVHGIGGIIGALLTGVFASKSMGGYEDVEVGAQFMIQLESVGFTVAYCAIATVVILTIIKAVMGLRVDEDQESEGLDIALHDEKGYNM